MANSNEPRGLVPWEYLGGAKWNGQCRTYAIASATGSAFAIGDPVVLAGTGTTEGIAHVTIATPGSALVGVIVAVGGTVYGGPMVQYSNTGTTVLATSASGVHYVQVVDDPNVIFMVQEVGTGTQLTSSEIGLNANLVAGTNNGYVSGWMINNSGEATTDTLDVKLLGLAQIPNNAFGQYAKWLVLLNNHLYRYGITGK